MAGQARGHGPRLADGRAPAAGRDRPEAALSLRGEPPDGDERDRIRSRAVDLQDLANLLREQGQAECVAHYTEAMELARQIGDRQAEAVMAFNIGTAHAHDVPSLYDLDEAERWFWRSLELRPDDDRLGRGKTIGLLATIAYRRAEDAVAAGAREEERRRLLGKAASASLQALELLPGDAVQELAIGHGQLGVIYEKAGELDAALAQYTKSIGYYEQAGNRFGAGRTRSNSGVALRDAGRLEDARLYLEAALRDFQSVGAGAAVEIQKTRELIASLGHRDP